MSNTKDISNLYEVLFDTINSLKNGEIDIVQAKAINESAQVIINAGKLQVDYLKMQEKKDSSFFEDKRAAVEDSLRKIEEKKKQTYQLSQ